MPDHPSDFRRLLLTARGGDGLHRPPLGSRARVGVTTTELLPRLVLDVDGRGTFRRGGAEMVVQLVGDPVTAIELTLPDPGETFLPPLERVTARTGWQLVDPDKGEVLFPRPAVGPGKTGRTVDLLRSSVGAVLVMTVIAGIAWWALLDSGNDAPRDAPRVTAAGASLPGGAQTASPGSSPTGTLPPATAAGQPRQDAAATVSQAPAAGAMPGPGEVSPEAFMAQAQQVAAFMNRRRALAPEFRDLRVVHELLMAGGAEAQFQATLGNGRYVDPALLSDSSRLPPEMGGPLLPPEFAEPVRGGYRFSFTGEAEGSTFLPEFNPGYQTYAYVAVPEPGSDAAYTFALRGSTGRIHYTTDGRIPTDGDPSVTDRVAVDAPEVIKQVEAEPNETGLMRRLRGIINRFLGSETVQQSQMAYHEERAIGDLRRFAVAQEAFLATVAGQGYASPEVLSDPAMLEGAPPIGPFLERSFTQRVREGYQFTFTGVDPVGASGSVVLFRDYSYVAVPVGTGPAGRRSFGLFADGVVRVREDGAPPQKSDRMLGHE